VSIWSGVQVPSAPAFTIAEAEPIRCGGTDSPAIVKPSMWTPASTPTANITTALTAWPEDGGK
jgi:hypothetical protein